MNSGKKIQLYDCTLREGSQTRGVQFSLPDKLRIAEKLDEVGVGYIEGGWPTPGNEADREFFANATKLGLRARITAFGSTRRKSVKCEDDPILKGLTECNVPAITIFGKSWDLHVTEVLGTTLQENIDMIGESISYLKKHADEVIYDAEHFFDGYACNPEYARKTIEAALQAGADCIVLCDTNGGSLPDGVARVCREIGETIDSDLGIHAHNDTGCAVANTMMAVESGIVHIHGTINGLGERCGNADMCTCIPNLQIKKKYHMISDKQLSMLTETSIFVDEMANMTPNIRLPYVGKAAFTHKAGTHADAVRKNRNSFEHIDPQLVGNTRDFIISDMAGSGSILEKISAIKKDLNKKSEPVRRLLEKIKRLESEGYHFEAADASFELIAKEELGLHKETFQLKGFRVIEERNEHGEVHSEATIKVQKGGDFEHTAAEGDGPVNALDNALRKALVKFYPFLANVRLDDFKVRVLDGKEGTAAKVRVLIESNDTQNHWSTIGVSTNIIEASWLALVDSLQYKLMMEEHE